MRPHALRVLILSLLAMPNAFAEDCLDPGRPLLDAETEVVDFYLKEAGASLERAVDSFACSGAVKPETAARYFRAAGMLQMLKEDNEAATSAFATARALAPDAWYDDFGDEARQLFDAADVREGEGTLVLRNLSKQDRVFIDGALSDVPHKVSPGIHLVQVTGSEGTAYYARVAEVADGEKAEIAVPDQGGEVPIAPSPQPAVKPDPQPDDPEGPWAAIVGAGGFGGDAQTVDSPGTFLGDEKSAGAVVGVASFGNVPVSNGIGVQWNAALPVQLPNPLVQAAVGPSIQLGSLAVSAGAGVTALSVVEGKKRRTTLAILPHLGAIWTKQALDVGGTLGWIPWSTTARIHTGYAVADFGPAALRIGAEAGLARGGFQENKPGNRKLTTSNWRAGLQLGLVFGS